METNISFKNNKILWMPIIIIFYYSLAIFLFWFTMEKSDFFLREDTTLTILIIIGLITTSLGGIGFTIFVIVHLLNWPNNIDIIGSNIYFKYIVKKDLIININDISQIYYQKEYGQKLWYDFHIIIELNNQEKHCVNYLQHNFIKYLQKITQSKGTDVNVIDFNELKKGQVIKIDKIISNSKKGKHFWLNISIKELLIVMLYSCVMSILIIVFIALYSFIYDKELENGGYYPYILGILIGIQGILSLYLYKKYKS